ncbi:hypothetical protein CGC58_11405 [Capnocytophaga stomatis]|uniref:Uncharacterized protein n=2 Tax=Capnocytophaga stomatis TaxID=1848904 RepID=A0A250FZ54_9FLAO|nr:hypothetical protein CGC58_11405 [Capnocytophaga stomatis]
MRQSYKLFTYCQKNLTFALLKRVRLRVVILNHYSQPHPLQKGNSKVIDSFSTIEWDVTNQKSNPVV